MPSMTLASPYDEDHPADSPIPPPSIEWEYHTATAVKDVAGNVAFAAKVLDLHLALDDTDAELAMPAMQKAQRLVVRCLERVKEADDYRHHVFQCWPVFRQNEWDAVKDGQPPYEDHMLILAKVDDAKAELETALADIMAEAKLDMRYLAQAFELYGHHDWREYRRNIPTGYVQGERYHLSVMGHSMSCWLNEP